MTTNTNARDTEVFRTRISFPGFQQSILEDVLGAEEERHVAYYRERHGIDIPPAALDEIDFSDAVEAVSEAYFTAYADELNARLEAEGFSAVRLAYGGHHIPRDMYVMPDYIAVEIPAEDLRTLRRYADSVTAWDQRMYPGGREETFEELADRCARGGYAAFPAVELSELMTWEQGGVLFDFCLSDEELFRSCDGVTEDLSLVANDALAAQFADLAERVRAGEFDDDDDAD